MRLSVVGAAAESTTALSGETAGASIVAGGAASTA